MPSVRFSRDKRGYEYVYLMHTPTRRGKPGRSHVLYWYRTPPGVLIGRKPFSEDVQRMLEAQNPGVSFDWPAIISTPMPPPDMTEFWRERRRAAKAAKQQSRSQDEDESQSDEPLSVEIADAVDPITESAAPGDQHVNAQTGGDEPAPESAGEDAGARKRRRRRGGRRRKGGTEQQAQTADGVQAEGDQMSLASPAQADSEIPSEPVE